MEESKPTTTSVIRVVAIQLSCLVVSQIILFFFLKMLIYSSVLQSRIPEDVIYMSEVERTTIQNQLAQDFQKDLVENPHVFTNSFFDLLFGDRPGLLFWNSLFWGLSFLPFAYWLLHKKMGWKVSLFSEPFQFSHILQGASWGIGLFLFVTLSTAVLSALGVEAKNNFFQAKLLRSLHENANLMVWSLYTIGLMTGVMEELYFRGFFFQNFVGLNMEKAGLVISSVVFGMVHYSPESSWYIPILLSVVGFGFGRLYQISGSLYASASAHAVYNSIGIVMAYFLGDKILS